MIYSGFLTDAAGKPLADVVSAAVRPGLDLAPSAPALTAAVPPVVFLRIWANDLHGR